MGLVSWMSKRLLRPTTVLQSFYDFGMLQSAEGKSMVSGELSCPLTNLIHLSIYLALHLLDIKVVLCLYSTCIMLIRTQKIIVY